MPIIPPQLQAPYDTTDYVMNLVRSIGNDAVQTIAGNLLASGKPYVAPFINSGYRYIQRKLANAGYATFKKTVQILNITAVPTVDPGTRASLSYTGYFDGTNQFTTPALPADLCWPLKLRERRHGTTQMFQGMFIARDGLQSRPQSIWLRDWIWENDQIFLNGATQVNDLEMLYVPFLPELTTVPASKVLIIRCDNALAAYTLWAYAIARGEPLADTILAIGDKFLREMMASDAMFKQRGNNRRRGYSARAHAGWGQF